jgi:hypothetical protein
MGGRRDLPHPPLSLCSWGGKLDFGVDYEIRGIYSKLQPVWRIRDVYPGTWFLPIPNPKTATKDRGEKKFFVKPFFVATNFTKLNIILFLICWRKKFGPIFQELLKFLPKKLSPSPQKYGFGIRDPEKNLFRIPDPGVKKAPDPGSGSAKLAPA